MNDKPKSFTNNDADIYNACNRLTLNNHKITQKVTAHSDYNETTMIKRQKLWVYEPWQLMPRLKSCKEKVIT